jgi:hypothetical protein
MIENKVNRILGTVIMGSGKATEYNSYWRSDWEPRGTALQTQSPSFQRIAPSIIAKFFPKANVERVPVPLPLQIGQNIRTVFVN